MSQVAHQVGTYPCFCSMKQLGVFLLSLDGMLVLIYTPEWKEALWELSVLLKNTIQCSQPGLEARLLEIEKKMQK